jgi:hypothetical protein
MLKTIFIYILKPHLNGIFFIFSALILLFIIWQLRLYSKSAKRKIPFSILFVSGFTIFVGAESLILSFMIAQEAKNFALIFLMKAILFCFAIVAICLGIFLVKLKKWSRTLTLWIVVVFGMLDTFITLTGADYTSVAVEVGIYCVIFTLYYLGLDKKYFKSDDEGFSLHPDAAIKRKDKNIFDWLEEQRK